MNVPLFVTHRKAFGYRLHCLFLPQIHATAKRYESALNKLRQAVVQHFQGSTSDRASLDERLWLSFAPALHFERVPLGFDAGRRWVEGRFAAAQFSVGGRRYACLPQLEGTIADLGDNHLAAAERQQRLVACLQVFFREQRKLLGDDFEPQQYLAAANDELGEMTLSMPFAHGRFPFESGGDLLAALHDDDVGDGASEMARVAVDLTEHYPDGLTRAILCDDAVQALEHAIGRPEAAAIVLVGPRGAGKSALLQGALRRAIEARPGHERSRLQKIWRLDPLRVVSGMSVIGQWQRRMAVVLQHLRSRLLEAHGIDRPDHLYCDNLVALLSIGKSAQTALTLADVLRPHLEKRRFTMIGEATPEAWQTLQQRDRRFADLFRVIRVDAPPRETAVRIVNARRAELEQQHGCRISAAALAELLKMERRFGGDEVLPGSALRVLDRLAVRHAQRDIGRDEVMAAFTAAFHFREALFSRHVGLAPADAAAHFAARLIGQPAACAALVDGVALIKSGLAPPGRPLGSLLFIGPTGVGKSEAAKLLADYLFEGEGGLVRFDMNECVDAGAPARLIGDATRPDGQLTAAVRQRRACVLLLDEIEKAHPAVHDLLLQLLGEGRLTDALGRTTDFSHCVVVLTSNLGAAQASRRTGFSPQAADVAHTYREAVERFFRPEFLNRIDQVVGFAPLAASDMAAIARLQIERLMGRDGFVRRLSFLSVSDAALAHLARLGHDEALGARALKRGIERALTGPIAQRLAQSAGGQPMLLDVAFDGGVLETRATVLNYAVLQPLPLPDDAGEEQGYPALAAFAQALHDVLRGALDASPAEAIGLALRALQVRLDPLREVIDRRCWALAERRGVPARPPVRPKMPGQSSSWRASGRPLLGAVFAQLDILAFFDALHADAEPLRAAESELLRWRLELDALARRAGSLASRGIEQLAIEIAPLQAGAPKAIVDTAWADYAGLLAPLDLHELPAPRAGVRAFEGPGLRDAFGGECGVHLWYAGDDRPVPLALRLMNLAEARADAAAAAALPWPTEIIRIRLEPGRPGDHRRLSDLRSGRVRKFTGPLSEHDWRLLHWPGGERAALPEALTMAKPTHPLLCWQLDAETVFGILLGADLEAVERNPKRLRTALAETLQREHDRGRYVPEPEIESARLKLVTVSVSLAHRTEKGAFALPRATDFLVAAVFGTNTADGYAKCYLPWLDESFFYYDDAQLPLLIEHYTRERLDGIAPEAAQRYRMPSTPWLEPVDARVSEHASRRAPVPRHLREAHAKLATIADRLPETGARRGLHVFPETAWEQGALVDAIAGRLLKGGNLLLVGEPGVGKSVVILEAIRKAHRLGAASEAPPSYWRSHAERLIGRARYLGEWQAMCDQAVQWLQMSDGVLWVSDFVNLLQAGGENPEDSMAAYLLPALRGGRLRLVGEANASELETARQRLPAFIDCFETLPLPEMEGPQARRVLELFAAHAKNTLAVEIEQPALDTGYRLLARFVRYERFPGKAVTFFGDCVRSALAEQRGTVSETAAIAHFARTTGLPETFLRDDRPLVEAQVHAWFTQRLVGQPAAVRQLQEVVYLFKAGLNDPGKPIATLLFAGPTGVGKTAAAKALAGFFFGAGGNDGHASDPLFRLDMSEFQHAFQIERLIGSGNRPGKLIEHVRQRPFSVLLLDEIEKADASVFDLLLTALDEGRLRDSRGRVTDLRGSLIVMTTNLGVRHGSSIGFGADSNEGEAQVLHEIRQFFRPEFFNRIDRVVGFVPLGREAIEAIARQELQVIDSREGLLRRGLRLRFTAELVAFIAATGFSPKYGARPLQRAVEQHVVAAVARALFGPVADGACLEVGLEGGVVQVRAVDGAG